MLIEIKEVSVRILCSNSYIEGDEYYLASIFNITYVQHFFPHKFFKQENFGYVGQIVPLEQFMLPSDDNNIRALKEIFYSENIKVDNWSFLKEIEISINLKLQLLTNAMLYFIRECFKFQRQLQNPFNGNFINPFNNPICSLGGLMYNVFGYYYQNNLDIYCVNNEYGYSNKTVSRIEHKYTSFQHYLYPDRNLVSAFSSEFGQKYFKEAIPDLFCEDTLTAFNFLGCQIHGHFENCSINPNANENSKNPFGKSFKELNEDLNQKVERLLLREDGAVKEVVLQWECNFRNQMKNDPVLKHFLDNYYLSAHPLQRLKPRDCLRGAFVDTYAHKWKQTLNQKFYCLDVNGLYSYCCIRYPFMLGKYEIIMGKKLDLIKISENKMFYNDERIMGSILCTILPPQNLKYPFLMYRKVDGTSVNTLCKQCAETLSKICKHSNQERALTAVYMITEVEFALTLGYTLMYIYELHVYTRFETFLSPFVKCLNTLKTQSSDLYKKLPKNMSIADYCRHLNQIMELKDENLLRPSKIKPNVAKRNFYKLAANSFFGKYSQRLDRTLIHYVSNQTELERVAQTENIEDIFCLSEDVCMLTVTKNTKLPPNLKANVYIGSQITAYGRQYIYEQMLRLQEYPKCTIFHVNCDSLYFTFDDSLSLPFTCSEAVGDFKHVYDGDILSYLSFGPRRYVVTYQNRNNLVTETHISGLSLKQIQPNFDFDILFSNFLEKAAKQINDTFIFNQFKHARNLKEMKVNTYAQKFSLNNHLSTRRYLQIESNILDTLPYGFNM